MTTLPSTTLKKMKTLNTINKTFDVFRILTKVLMILGFVAVDIELLSGILTVAVMNGAGNFDLSLLMEISEGADLKFIATNLFTDVIYLVSESILLLFAFRYFTKELSDGTPFTLNGAKQVKNLGIITIILPQVAELTSITVHYFTGYEDTNSGYTGFIVLGITLILISLILKHGTEIQNNNDEVTAPFYAVICSDVIHNRLLFYQE